MVDTKKITYKEMKLRQKEDLRSKRIVNSIYRNISTVFAYIFVKLGVSPNAITISSWFLCIFGFIFLSIGAYPYIITGLIFFNMFMTFDYTDGEVARIQNKQSLEGQHFEYMQEYIYRCCLGIGLGVGLFSLYRSHIYLYLGFLLTFLLIVEYAIGDLLKSVLRKGIIDKMISKTISDRDIQKELQEKMTEGHNWAEQNIFLRLFGVYPPGLIFSSVVISLILVVLTIIEYLLSIFTNFPLAMYGQTVGILSIYLLIVSIVKLIEVTILILKLEKDRPITKFLEELSK